MKIISKEKQPPVKTFKEPVDLVDTHESTIFMLQFMNQKYYEKLSIACFTVFSILDTAFLSFGIGKINSCILFLNIST